MRRFLFTTFVFAVGLVLAAADGWGTDDYELFRLKDELEVHEGPGVTFYDFLGISPSATQDQITRAYRKKSKLLHPDKAKEAFIASKLNPASDPKKKKAFAKRTTHVRKRPSERQISSATKEASERFARLGLIAKILRSEGRERYDHFLNNGFPKWRGTGYYYQRYRPGLASTLGALFIFAGGLVHYVFLHMSWQRHRRFMEKCIKQARKDAWGDESALLIPGVDFGNAGNANAGAQPSALDGGDEQAASLNRRQKRMQERETKKEAKKTTKRGRPTAVNGTGSPQGRDTSSNNGPEGARRRVQAENGKVLVVDSLGDVYLEEENKEGKPEQLLLDPNSIIQPTIKDTVLCRIPIWAYESSIGRVLARKERVYNEADDSGSDGQEGEEGWEKVRAAGVDEEGVKHATKAVQAATRGAKKRGKSS